jgi:hypothetical protein
MQGTGSCLKQLDAPVVDEEGVDNNEQTTSNHIDPCYQSPPFSTSLTVEKNENGGG